MQKFSCETHLMYNVWYLLLWPMSLGLGLGLGDCNLNQSKMKCFTLHVCQSLLKMMYYWLSISFLKMNNIPRILSDGKMKTLSISCFPNEFPVHHVCGEFVDFSRISNIQSPVFIKVSIYNEWNLIFQNMRDRKEKDKRMQCMYNIQSYLNIENCISVNFWDVLSSHFIPSVISMHNAWIPRYQLHSFETVTTSVQQSSKPCNRYQIKEDVTNFVDVHIP